MFCPALQYPLLFAPLRFGVRLIRVICESSLGSRATQVQVLAVIGLIWAGIYLPGLGSVELKHEEPRRALPAVHMVANGDWVVPRVGSVPYLRKPPLLNWLIASGFVLGRGRSEWAVRLPSALATLTLALAIVIFGGRWLGLQGGFTAAVLFLTNLALLESGRLAELEAVYIAVTGIALVIWLWRWQSGAEGWRLWFWPGIFLALGLLTKGPTHLIFFYGIVIPVLTYAKELRLLLQPSHWMTVLLMLTIFSAWAIPCSLAVGQHDPIAIWQFWIRQITSRASETEAFRLQNWLLNFPQTLKNFLPWTPLLALLWLKQPRSAAAESEENSGYEETQALLGSTEETTRRRLRAVFTGARLGMVMTCIFMCLLPNGSPRYVYPLFVVPCLLLAQVFVERKSDWRVQLSLRFWHWFNALALVIGALAVLAIPLIAGLNPISILAFVIGIGVVFFGFLAWSLDNAKYRSVELAAKAAVTTATVFVVGMITYGVAIVPRVNALTQNGAREVAAEIRQSIPAGATLWVQEDQYRPFWYYLEPEVTYFRVPTDVPATADYFLLPEGLAKAFMQDSRWKEAHLQRLNDVVDSEGKHFVVIGTGER